MRVYENRISWTRPNMSRRKRSGKFRKKYIFISLNVAPFFRLKSVASSEKGRPLDCIEKHKLRNKKRATKSSLSKKHHTGLLNKKLGGVGQFFLCLRNRREVAEKRIDGDEAKSVAEYFACGLRRFLHAY